MKRFFILVLAFLALVPCANAQERGALTNVFASVVTVTYTQKTVTLPFNSRDLTFINGSTKPVCISPSGKNIINDTTPFDSGCSTDVGDQAFILPSGEQINLYDFITGSITLKTSIASIGLASPISIISTY